MKMKISGSGKRSVIRGVVLAAAFAAGAGCSSSLPETPSIASPAARTPGVYRSGSSMESIPADKARQMLNDPNTPEATKRMLRQRTDL